MKPLSTRTIVRDVTHGKRTVEQVVMMCLDRIAEREPQVQAWAYFDPQRVIAEARRLNAAARHGPLHGVPIAIKDTIDTYDMPTAYGSPIYSDHRPVADAACIALLRDAGALILGKTVTTEFAATFPGKTRNPHNPEHTPGGSSSGSAAAVGAGMVPVALATQTMGSLIRPAAYCGAVGFKPSFATINRAGVKPQAESLDTIGVIARNVDDAAMVVSILVSGRDDIFGALASRPPRIAVYRGPDWSKAEPPAVAALDKAAARFAAAGAQVTEIDPPDILRDAYDAQTTFVFYEMAHGVSDEWFRHRDELSGEFSAFVAGGFKTSFSEYLQAEAVARSARRWMERAFETADLWMTLSAPGEAPKGANTGDIAFNRLWSFLHLPALTLPVGVGPNGLPLGVQLIGRYRADADLIAFGRWAEERLQ